MRHKNVEVTPYTNTYCAFNKHTGDKHGKFDTIFDAVSFVKTQPRRHHRQDYLTYTRKLEADNLYENESYVYSYNAFNADGTRRRWWETRKRVVTESYHYPAPDWVIVNDLGEMVDQKEVEDANRRPYRSYWGSDEWERKQTLKGRRLTRIKGSADKVKESCARVLDPYRDGTAYYTNMVRGYHRSPGTINEKRQTEGHIDEYGQEMVRGRRRKRTLPSAWDDRPISIYDTENSWKHHSKRRRQWVPK